MTDRHMLPPYSLRIPDDLRAKLAASAKQSKRSLNAEITARLEESYENHAFDFPAGLAGVDDAMTDYEKHLLFGLLQLIRSQPSVVVPSMIRHEPE